MLRLLFALIILFSSTAQLGFAHETKYDGDISVFLHVSPNDTAVAGKESELHIILNRKFESFKNEDCLCYVEIKRDDTILKKEEILKGENSFTSIPYTFQNTGIYQIKIYGNPKEDADFGAFEITFDERVEEGAQKFPIDALCIILAGTLLGLFGWLLSRKNTYAKNT